MKFIFTDQERDAIRDLLIAMAQDRSRKMRPYEAKVLGETMERISGYRDKDKFDEVHLFAIGHILEQVLEANKDSSEDVKPVLDLYSQIVEKLQKKLD